MPLSDNFDALFAATYQQEGLPELLPGERAQALLAGLDRSLDKLVKVAISKVTPPSPEDEMRVRLDRMFRFYRAVEDFADADFLSEIHSESERDSVLRLIEDLRSIRHTIADAVEEKSQQVNEAAQNAAQAILEEIEARRAAQEAGDIIAQIVEEQWLREERSASESDDENYEGYPTFDEFMAEDDSTPEVLVEIDDDYYSDDYDEDGESAGKP